MRQEFLLPDPGEGLTDADIVSWLVAPGDAVTVNQPILEIETAKSMVELPSPWDGTVIELLAPEGANVPIGTPVIAVEVADAEGADDGTTTPPTAVVAASEPAPAPEVAAAPATSEGSGAVLVGYGTRENDDEGQRRITRPEDVRRVLAKPPVRKLARDLGIDLSVIAGSGPGGIVTRGDLMEHHQAMQAQTYALYPGDEPWLVGGRVSPDGRRTRVPVKSVRRRTAEATVTSAFTAPHVSVTHTVDVTRTMDLLARLKLDREFEGIRLTPLLFVMKALLIAVHRHPDVNASWDAENQEIVYKHYVNLGIAASTPRGLVVPNIKDAHRLSLKALARELTALTQTARAGKSTPADMSDGTITITNVGAFGIDTGTPILNPGEAAILAFGTVREQPWVRDGQLVPAHVTTLTLSFDHRLVDGELGALVLRDVCAVLEDPAQALVWS
ncbi:MAG TPA: dihydrolipoamide acetyltransferase family protein [Actinomycetaceae bacterium]|nr:dihydrolipoamide acetyltransferase family protein [Actinomycetaceae bacterium]